MPQPSLATLPVELIHHITSSLPTLDHSILSLRATNRALSAAITTAPAFRAAFTTRTADLANEPSLSTLAAVAAHPTLGPLIRTIVLRTCHFDGRSLAQHGRTSSSSKKCGHDEAEVGGARNNGAAMWRIRRSSGRDAELLDETFGGVAAAGGRFEAVKLEAGVFEGGEGGRRMGAWEVRTTAFQGDDDDDDDEEGYDGRGVRSEKVRLWEAMAHDFGVVLGAMVRAGTRVRELSVYGGEWGGSVGAREVGEAMDAVPREALERCLSQVKVLRGFVSFGGVGDFEAGRWGGVVGEGGGERIGEFLGMAKALEDLDLLLYANYRPYDDHQRLFHGLVTPIVGGMIRSIRLRGFQVRAADLLDLIRKCRRLEELELQEVVLGDGRWREVFGLLREQESKLRRLTMYRLYERLYERRPPIIITRPEDCELQQQSRTFDKLYQMDGEQVQSGVKYSRNTVQAKGSGTLYSYQLRTRRLYTFS